MMVVVFANSQDSTNNKKDTLKEKTTVTVAALFGSNIDFYGQVPEQRLPYIALNAAVRIPQGVYFSAIGYHLFSDSLFLSASSLTLGYDFNISKKLSGDVSYSHTLYPDNSPILQASSPGLASASLSYDYFLKTTMGADAAFGRQTDFFVTLANSKAFDLTVSNSRAILSFTPELVLVAGTQEYYEEYLVQKEKTNKGKGKGNNNGNSNPPGQTRIETIDYKKFGLLSYGLKLPLSYNRASYLAEAAFKMALLGNNTPYKGNINTFFTLGVYYQF